MGKEAWSRGSFSFPRETGREYILLRTPTEIERKFHVSQFNVWWPDLGRLAGKCVASCDAVAALGSEIWFFDVVYSPKYLGEYDLSDVALVNHARKIVEEALSCAARVRSLSCGEDTIEIWHVLDEEFNGQRGIWLDGRVA